MATRDVTNDLGDGDLFRRSGNNIDGLSPAELAALPEVADQFAATAAFVALVETVDGLSLGSGNMPIGGTAGQVLNKTSATDFAAAWADGVHSVNELIGDVVLDEYDTVEGWEADATVHTAGVRLVNLPATDGRWKTADGVQVWLDLVYAADPRLSLISEERDTLDPLDRIVVQREDGTFVTVPPSAIASASSLMSRRGGGGAYEIPILDAVGNVTVDVGDPDLGGNWIIFTATAGNVSLDIVGDDPLPGAVSVIRVSWTPSVTGHALTLPAGEVRGELPTIWLVDHTYEFEVVKRSGSGTGRIKRWLNPFRVLVDTYTVDAPSIGALDYELENVGATDQWLTRVDVSADTGDGPSGGAFITTATRKSDASVVWATPADDAFRPQIADGETEGTTSTFTNALIATTDSLELSIVAVNGATKVRITFTRIVLDSVTDPGGDDPVPEIEFVRYANGGTGGTRPTGTAVSEVRGSPTAVGLETAAATKDAWFGIANQVDYSHAAFLCFPVAEYDALYPTGITLAQVLATPEASQYHVRGDSIPPYDAKGGTTTANPWVSDTDPKNGGSNPAFLVDGVFVWVVTATATNGDTFGVFWVETDNVGLPPGDVGQAQETDTALALVLSGATNVGQATEVEIALALQFGDAVNSRSFFIRRNTDLTGIKQFTGKGAFVNRADLWTPQQAITWSNPHDATDQWDKNVKTAMTDAKIRWDRLTGLPVWNKDTAKWETFATRIRKSQHPVNGGFGADIGDGTFGAWAWICLALARRKGNVYHVSRNGNNPTPLNPINGLIATAQMLNGGSDLMLKRFGANIVTSTVGGRPAGEWLQRVLISIGNEINAPWVSGYTGIQPSHIGRPEWRVGSATLNQFSNTKFYFGDPNNPWTVGKSIRDLLIDIGTAGSPKYEVFVPNPDTYDIAGHHEILVPTSSANQDPYAVDPDAGKGGDLSIITALTYRHMWEKIFEGAQEAWEVLYPGTTCPTPLMSFNFAHADSDPDSSGGHAGNLSRQFNQRFQRIIGRDRFEWLDSHIYCRGANTTQNAWDAFSENTLTPWQEYWGRPLANSEFGFSTKIENNVPDDPGGQASPAAVRAFYEYWIDYYTEHDTAWIFNYMAKNKMFDELDDGSQGALLNRRYTLDPDFHPAAWDYLVDRWGGRPAERLDFLGEV